MCGHRAQTWKFARSQVSAVLSGLRPDRITFVRAWICTDDARASPISLQPMDRRCYISVKHWSAEPACAAPRSRWEQCVSIYLVCHTSHSLSWCKHQVCKQAYQPSVLIGRIVYSWLLIVQLTHFGYCHSLLGCSSHHLLGILHS